MSDATREPPIEASAGPSRAREPPIEASAGPSRAREPPIEASAGPSRARDPPIEASAGPSRAREPPIEASAGPSRAREPPIEASAGPSRARKPPTEASADLFPKRKLFTIFALMRKQMIHRRILALAAFLTLALMAAAQSDLTWFVDKSGKIFVLPKMKQYHLEYTPLEKIDLTPRGSRAIDLEHLQLDLVPQPTVEERPADMRVLSGAMRPFFDPFFPMHQSLSPTGMGLDFDELYVYPLADQVDFLARGAQYSWPGIAGTTTFSTLISWHNDRLRITGGAFGGRYFTPFTSDASLMVGAHLHISYQATDWMKLHAWGDYFYHDPAQNRNGYLIMNPNLNLNQVGGGVEFKVSDNFSFGVGANFQYHPGLRGMRPGVIFAPIFDMGNGWRMSPW